MGQELVLEKSNLHVANRTYSSGKSLEYQAFSKDAPVKYVNVLPCPHLVVTLWEHALSHLNTPAKSNLSRSFLQLLGNGNDNRVAQDEKMKRPGQQRGWHLEQHLVKFARAEWRTEGKGRGADLLPPASARRGLVESFRASAAEDDSGLACSISESLTNRSSGMDQS
uniref:Uncharacterized protein n=1 Tax=Oryza punctata TaxID=4537 RepID=A0A0E0L3B7_ORYPU